MEAAEQVKWINTCYYYVTRSRISNVNFYCLSSYLPPVISRSLLLERMEAGKDKTHTLLGENSQRQKEQVEKGKAGDWTALFEV